MAEPVWPGGKVVTHLTTSQVDAYWARRLAPADLLSLGRHIELCQPCRGALLAAAPPAILPDLGDSAGQDDGSAGGHLEYEQVKRYIETGGAPDDTGAIEGHLAVCADCRADVEDLRRFRGEYVQRQNVRPAGPLPMRGRFRARWWWAVAAAAAAASCFLLLRVPSGRRTGPSVEKFGVVLRDSGRPLALDRGGALRGLPDLPPSERATIGTILAGGNLPLAAFDPELASNGGPARGLGEAAPEFGPTDPLARVILEDRPLFQWTALPGAASYRVEVFDLKGHPAAASPSLTATQWRSDKPLARGSVYSWQVTALRAGRELRAPLPPASEARFRVLEGTRASALMSTLARVPVSHLALSALYAEAGMDRESLGELELLQQENPGSPLLVRLRAQLLARRPPR